jgi:nicotinate phosphoribosyltransferase
MNVNFAERAHNHNWKLDPIIRSLLDTDFYKLLMLQFIWKNFPATRVTSEVHNRTVRVRLAERVSASALRDKMEHVRGLQFLKSELVWLAGTWAITRGGVSIQVGRCSARRSAGHVSRWPS